MDFASDSIRRVVEALQNRPDVSAITLFGSHARRAEAGVADEHSDVDLQVVADAPSVLLSSDWVTQLIGLDQLKAWNVREAFGGVKKVSVLLADGELDLVILPHSRMRLARWAVLLGQHRRSKKLQRKLGDLVLVMGGGFRVLKGGAKWERFLNQVVAEVPEPRLSLAEVENLWAAAQVDYQSIIRKLDRGELIAAQRWLHTGMVETNLNLLHELKRRRGEISFHDGRRAETTIGEDELPWVRVTAALDAGDIRREADGAIIASRELVENLRQLLTK